MLDSEKELIKEMMKEQMESEQAKSVLELPTQSEIAKTQRKPDSQFEIYLLDFYKQLKVASSPDHFDKWVENGQIAKYKRFSAIVDFFGELLVRLSFQKGSVAYEDGKEFVQKALFKVVERKCEGGEAEPTLSVVRDFVNAKTKKDNKPELINELTEFDNLSAEDYKRMLEEQIEQKIADVEQNWDLYKDQIEQIKSTIDKIKTSDLEKMAAKLNTMLDIGKDAWTLLIVSMMSPYCPQVPINGVEQRNAMHVLLVGDIASGKSTANKILSQLSPNGEMFSKITEASFEGVSTKDGTDEGLLDSFDRTKGKGGGVLFINEFDKFASMPLLKELMDNGLLKTMKGGNRKENDINMAMICAANPKSDFFSKQLLLRDQIEFREAVMSRFDVMIPIVNSSKKISYLMDNMVLFGHKDTSINLRDESVMLTSLATMMRKIKKVEILPEHQKQIIDTAKIHVKELDTRPLVLLRDIESLCRFINTVSIINSCIRSPTEVATGLVKATQDDIDLCCKLWEYIINLRETVYTQQTRNILDIKGQILLAISRETKIDSEALCASFVAMKTCSKTTFYEKVKDLIMEEKVKTEGLRDRLLFLNVSADEVAI